MQRRACVLLQLSHWSVSHSSWVFLDSLYGRWREVSVMMVIMLALSSDAVFICWLELHIPWSVSGPARSDAD